MDSQLHHSAIKIVPASLESVMELFGLLNCKVVYREDGARWAMIGQDRSDFKIQLVEADEQPIRSKHRTSSHVAFISHEPKAVIAALEDWARGHGVRFEQGGWNERELWFDLPGIFVDFVIEVMDRSVIG